MVKSDRAPMIPIVSLRASRFDEERSELLGAEFGGSLDVVLHFLWIEGIFGNSRTVRTGCRFSRRRRIVRRTLDQTPPPVGIPVGH